MTYNIEVNNSIVGIGLSNGELNQWILNYIKSLDSQDQETFVISLGFVDFHEDHLNDDMYEFENYIYSNEFKIPLNINLTSISIRITEFEY